MVKKSGRKTSNKARKKTSKKKVSSKKTKKPKSRKTVSSKKKKTQVSKKTTAKPSKIKLYHHEPNMVPIAEFDISKKHLKAFLAGMFFPAVMIALLMPVGLTLNLPIQFLYFFPLAPILWGFWNLIYTDFINYFPARHHLGVAGAVLGFILGVVNVFFLGIPQTLKITGTQVYAPLVVIPIVYYIIWRVFVHPVNQALGVHD